MNAFVQSVLAVAALVLSLLLLVSIAKYSIAAIEKIQARDCPSGEVSASG